MGPDFDAGALRQHLQEAWSQLNLSNLFNRQVGGGRRRADAPLPCAPPRAVGDTLMPLVFTVFSGRRRGRGG